MKCYHNNHWNHKMYYDWKGIIATPGLHKNIVLMLSLMGNPLITTSWAWLEYMKLKIQPSKEHNIAWNAAQTMFKSANQYLLCGSGYMHLILAEHKCLPQIFPSV